MGTVPFYDLRSVNGTVPYLMRTRKRMAFVSLIPRELMRQRNPLILEAPEAGEPVIQTLNVVSVVYAHVDAMVFESILTKSTGLQVEVSNDLVSMIVLLMAVSVPMF